MGRCRAPFETKVREEKFCGKCRVRGCPDKKYIGGGMCLGFGLPKMDAKRSARKVQEARTRSRGLISSKPGSN